MANDVEIVNKFMRSPPVDLKSIFRELGIKYQESLIAESGYIEKDGENYSVVVNSTEGPQRQRFTAAHELAHYLLHRPLLQRSRANRHTDRLFGGDAALNEESPFKAIHEVQANKLAAQILMPTAQIMASYKPQEDNVAALATLFEVSQAAMRIRLKNLGLRNSVNP